MAEKTITLTEEEVEDIIIGLSNATDIYREYSKELIEKLCRFVGFKQSNQ